VQQSQPNVTVGKPNVTVDERSVTVGEREGRGSCVAYGEGPHPC